MGLKTANKNPNSLMERKSLSGKVKCWPQGIHQSQGRWGWRRALT